MSIDFEGSKFTAESILTKIRGLITLAEGASTEAEADSARAFAEKLMLRYRIAEEEILAVDPTSIEPIVRTIDIAMRTSQFWQNYLDLFGAVARHCGVRAKYEWDFNAGSRRLLAYTVGYETDIRYAELLFTSAQLVFSARLEPAVDTLLSDADNVYRLRSAGIERNRIARLLWHEDTHAAHARVGKLYREACEARGEDAAVSGRKISAKTYRTVFAVQFVSTFRGRLSRAQDAAGAVGGTMALYGRSERVDEAFYTTFPELRPSTEVAASGPGRKSRARKAWTAADEARYQRLNESAAALVGQAAGTAAAEEVALRGPDRTPQVDRYTDEERSNSRAIWAAIEGR